jgi:uncharacterized protein (DUF1810 family)
VPDDRHNLARFVAAQEGVFARVCAELALGRKESHWMWFILPQLAGLGASATARAFAIRSLAEARAYLEHPVLGVRLIECTQLVNGVAGRSVEEIFGYPDHLKFRSSMTLFTRAAGTSEEAQPFRAALAKYFAGEEDLRTVELLSSAS